jgi:hypothetical protein
MATSFLTRTAARFAFACPLTFTFRAIFGDLSLTVALRATDDHSRLLNRPFPQAFVAVEFDDPCAFTLMAIYLSPTFAIIALHRNPLLRYESRLLVLSLLSFSMASSQVDKAFP